MTDLARSKSDWLTIFAEQTDGTPEGCAARIFGDLWGYGVHERHNHWKAQDIRSLANALEAYKENYTSLNDLDAALVSFHSP